MERDAEASTGLALILIDQKGENSTVIATGANSKFSRESALKLRETIGTVDLVLLQLELPLDVVDTTAAGDAFSAALSVGIVEGKSLEEAVAFANAAGALAVTKLGARPSIPTLAELETFLSKS